MRSRHQSWNRALALGAAILALALPGNARAQARSGPEVWAANCGRCHRAQPTNKYDARHWAVIVTHMAQAARLTPDEEKAVRQFLVGTLEGDRGSGPSKTAGSEALDVGDISAERSAPRARTLLVMEGPGAGRGSTEGLEVPGWLPGGNVDSALAHTPEAVKLFAAQCAPCHGASGRGDGPVAAALQPKPANLSDGELQKERTDEQLREVIGSGKGTMPAFGKILTPDEISLLAEHIRWLAAEK